MKSILLIEDDQKITELLREYLAGFEYRTHAFCSPSRALERLKQGGADLVILDVMLPEEDGFSVLRKIRDVSDIPVIMLTARGEMTDRVVGLELGADDYMSKPFEPRELIARMRALLRRAERTVSSLDQAGQKLVFGDLQLDARSRMATLADLELKLTAMEFDILYSLARNAGIVLSRDQLTEILHGEEFEPFNRTIDILISRIRQKLGDSAEEPRFIRTVRGAGYLFLPGK